LDLIDEISIANKDPHAVLPSALFLNHFQGSVHIGVRRIRVLQSIHRSACVTPNREDATDQVTSRSHRDEAVRKLFAKKLVVIGPLIYANQHPKVGVKEERRPTA
jgi:hypothetical protein